jgi:hypothetical protein
MEPTHIEPATVFIESEFEKIGLKPMKGLTGYRQSFQKEQISPVSLEVILDGEKIAEPNLALVSEKTELNVTSGLAIQSIEYDKEVANKDQYFFDKAFAFIQDTTSAIVLVAPEFQRNFVEFKGYFGKRFLNNRKSTKVFVLGKNSVSTFSVKASQKIKAIKMNNVVGVLEGQSKADELVVFSGHYDHIGVLKSVRGDSIANGADDDASGTTAVIALAKYFNKVKSNRTLIFVAFTAEEIGGYGSQYFSKQLDPERI